MGETREKAPAEMFTTVDSVLIQPVDSKHDVTKTVDSQSPLQSNTETKLASGRWATVQRAHFTESVSNDLGSPGSPIHRLCIQRIRIIY